MDLISERPHDFDLLIRDFPKVYNALGLLVKTVQDTNEISVAGLPTGVYLMRIIDVNGIFHTERVTVIK